MSDPEFPTPNPRLDVQRPDPFDRNAPAADRLFNAIVCLLIERGAPLLADALKPEEVTARAGKARASYYRTAEFPGADALTDQVRTDVLEQLVARVLQASAADVSQVTGDIATYVENGWITDSPREFIRETSANNFDAMFDHTSVLQILAAALAPSSPAIADELGDYYRAVTDAHTRAYHEVFDFWKYRPRPPLTMEQFTTVVMALAEGLILRSFADPSIDRDTYAHLLEMVGGSLMVSMGDLARDTLPAEHHLPGAVPPPTRATLIATLLRLYEADRATLPTLDELARAAGCSPSTITSSFGGVVGMLHAAWAEWMPEFEEEASRSASSGSDSLTTLYRVAIAVAKRAAEQLPLTRALLMSEAGMAHTAAAIRPEPISELFDRLLRSAERDGQLRPPAVNLPDLPIDDTAVFARALRTLLLTIVSSGPPRGNRTADEHARWGVDYVWAMMMPARRPIT